MAWRQCIELFQPGSAGQLQQQAGTGGIHLSQRLCIDALHAGFTCGQRSQRAFQPGSVRQRPVTGQLHAALRIRALDTARRGRCHVGFVRVRVHVRRHQSQGS